MAKGDEKKPDAASPWVPYAPNKAAPWDLRRVVHLHRRAGFAAIWDELQRDLTDGPKASIDRLLAGKTRLGRLPDDFERSANALADNAVLSGNPARLKAWWLHRILSSPDPLTERLTLLWHNHFATSELKVKNLAAMLAQNELFRKYARSPFGELLNAAIRDPALLVWLDAPANRKGQPNENLARELLELFTLGIGNYTEQDVKEGARALTGWTLADGRFREDPDLHDPGEKTILGHKGKWRGEDLVQMALKQPATARRLAWRICRLFLGERASGGGALDALADGLRRQDLDIGWAVETVLRSQLFFAEENLNGRVLGPVEYVIGSVRALECLDPLPSTLLLADWAARLGQDLFYPPNVGGWAEGRAWISTGTMIGRANYAAALVDGNLRRRAAPLDVVGLAKRHRRGGDPEALISFYGELLVGVRPNPAWRKRLLAALGEESPSTPKGARRLVAMLVASPEAQSA